MNKNSKIFYITVGLIFTLFGIYWSVVYSLLFIPLVIAGLIELTYPWWNFDTDK